MSEQERNQARTTGPSRLLEVYAETQLPTHHGQFRSIVFREKRTGVEHLALVTGEVANAQGALVRIHSECLTGEVLGSLKCDCKAQLDHALDLTARAGRGAVLYLRQEGRGIGLGNKIRAYALQAQGYDTFEANRLIGFQDDLRNYDIAAEMLRILGIASVELITNNPMKIAALIEQGISVKRRVPSLAPINTHNAGYLRAKVERTGHLIELGAGPLDTPGSQDKKAV